MDKAKELKIEVHALCKLYSHYQTALDKGDTVNIDHFETKISIQDFLVERLIDKLAGEKMNVFKLKFYANDTRPGCGKFDYDLYFNSTELALKYLSTKMPEYKEITEEVTKPWFTNYSTRTFTWEGKRYDENGDWDYPVEFTIELDQIEILEVLEE